MRLLENVHIDANKGSEKFESHPTRPKIASADCIMTAVMTALLAEDLLDHISDFLILKDYKSFSKTSYNISKLMVLPAPWKQGPTNRPL